MSMSESELNDANQKSNGIMCEEVNGKTGDEASALCRHKQLLLKPGVKEFCEFVDSFARTTKQFGVVSRGDR